MLVNVVSTLDFSQEGGGGVLLCGCGILICCGMNNLRKLLVGSGSGCPWHRPLVVMFPR